MSSSGTHARSLPSWATYTPQSDPGKTSLIDEEFQLRQKAFQYASEKVSKAYHHTMDHHVQKNVSIPLRRFFLQFQPGVSASAGLGNGNGNGNPHKRRRGQTFTQGEEQEHEDGTGAGLKFDCRQYIDSIQYHPSLLPIVNLHLFPSVQDRAQVVKILKRQLLIPQFQKTEHDEYPNEIVVGKQVSSLSEKRNNRSPDSVAPSHSHFQPAVCILTDVSTIHTNGSGRGNNRGYRDHGEYIRDVLIQCIQQETNPYEFMHLLAKRSTKSLKLGYSDRLIEWAGSTTTFNSIVIIFENPEVISRRHLDALLGTMANLRSGAGVPVCLVMSSIGGGTEGGFDLAGDGLNSEAGVVFKDFTLASSNILCNELFHNLYTKQALPVLLSNEVLQHIHKDFCHFNGSIAGVALQLKAALAHHFTKRGSFFSMADDSSDDTSSFLRRFGINLAWFCADSDARKWVFGKKNEFHNSSDLLQSMKQSFDLLRYRLALCNFASVVRKCILTADTDNKDNTSPDDVLFIMLHHSIGKSRHYKVLLEKLYDKVRKDSIRNLTEMLVHCYNAVQEVTISTDSRDLTSYLPADDSEKNTIPLETNRVKQLSEFLKNTIVSLEMLRTNNHNQEVIARHFREALVEKLHSILWDETSAWSDTTFSRLITFGVEDSDDHTSFLSSQTVEPRRLIASSISSPRSLDNDRSFDMSITLHALDTRIISTSYWFGQFAEKMSLYSVNYVSKEELLQRFAFAVYQLMYCGFAVRSRRKNDLFEKGAMVWASSHLK